MSGNSILGDALVAGSAASLNALPRKVLDDRDVSLLANVSVRLMSDPSAKALPDVMSFAFWCRKANLKALAERRGDLSNNMGCGLAFHIAPSNVPVNFAFSWAFALLAGNPSVVRLPSKPFPQIDVICSAVEKAMREAGDERTAFVSYESSSDITAKLAGLADVRVIWGGDDTVKKVRAMGSKPRCVDIAFADRYSIAVLDANEVTSLDEKALKRLAEAFYNDTYLMDQNACSSPMTVAWLNSCEDGKSSFWEAVRACAQERYGLQGAIATDKYVQLCRDAVDGRALEAISFDGWLDVVNIDPVEVGAGELGEYRGKGGYFYEIDIDGFEDIARLLDQRCQTVTYFGCDAEKIRSQVIECGLRGVDRIVPIGKAMDIDIIWDGMDLLSMMSRRVDVR